MSFEQNITMVHRTKIFSCLIGAFLVLAGSAVLLGWAIHSERLMRLVPRFVAMNPLTALCFIAGGISLLSFWTSKSKSISTLGKLLAYGIAIVGLFKLLDYLSAMDFPLDQMLFRDRLDADRTHIPNRMAPNTALNFLLCGIVLSLVSSCRTRHYRWAHGLSLAVLLNSLFALLGYMYGAAYLYGVGAFIPMALPTAILFFLLSLAFLCTQTEYGAVRLFVSDSAGGIIARRLLPFAIAIPGVLGALRLLGEKRGLYSAEFGVTIMVLSSIATFAALIWCNAVLLDRTDARRRRAEEQLRKAHDELESRVQQRTAELMKLNDVLRAEIIERKKAEEQIREQAELLDKAQDAIIVRDFAHRITYWNKGAERVYGWKAQEVMGKNSDDLLSFRNQQPRQAYENVLNKEDWSGELKQQAKGGQEIIVESRWTLIRDNHGKAKCILTIDTDITEKHKLKEQFLRAQRMESIGALAGGIAHDLNNALVPVTVGSQLLKEGVDTEEQRREIVQLILTSGQRCVQMVKQILTFARGSRGKFATVQLNQLIAEMDKIARDTFPKSIFVSTSVEEDLWAIEGDSTELHQVLMNLCVNARDAMPQGGRITLSAENVTLAADSLPAHPNARAGKFVKISVRDTGTGIPEHLKTRIFEPFFTTKPLDKGTGLGLSTVATLVKGHNGFLEVESEENRGTTFRIFLPVAEINESAKPEVKDVPLPVGHGELILIVDDEEFVIEIARTTLENYGYRVLTAPNGLVATACFEAHKKEIQLVLTDTDMPFMDGLHTIEAIKAIEPRIPIIVASGTKGDTDHLRRVNALRVITLSKPYNMEQLLRGVADALAGSQLSHPR